MKLFQILIASVFTVTLIGCSSVKITTDFDPTKDFNKYKTYRWASAKEINPEDYLAKHPLTQKRVMAAVDKVLADKGFTLVTGQDADFVVITHAGMKEKMNITQTGGGYGYGRYGGWYDPWWGPYGGSTHVSYYDEGSLVVDVVDYEAKELVWRGIATGTMSNKQREPEEEQQAIDEVVTKILADFPPGGPQHQGN